jgi:hypothetical protein
MPVPQPASAVTTSAADVEGTSMVNTIPSSGYLPWTVSAFGPV